MVREPVTAAGSVTAREAADYLNVSPATLRAWEQEFGFPTPVSSEYPTPNYLITELLALQDALPEALSIASAMRIARRRIAHTV